MEAISLDEQFITLKNDISLEFIKEQAFRKEAIDKIVLLLKDLETERLKNNITILNTITKQDKNTLNESYNLVDELRHSLTDAVTAMQHSLDAIYNNLNISCDAMNVLENTYGELSNVFYVINIYNIIFRIQI